MTATRLRPVLLLFVAALGLRLAFVLAYPQQPLLADSLDYDRLARSVASGRGFRDAHGEPETLRAPLYPLFVAGLYRMGGGPDPARVRVVQGVLGALVPVAVLSLGLACFRPRVAWLAAGVVACYPAFVAYTGLVLTETLACLLVSVVALVAVRAASTRALAWSALLGLALGLTALCRAELAAVAVAMGLATLAVTAGSWGARLARAAAMGACFLLALLPWTIRNYRTLGAFVPLTTDGWRTLWIASYPERWLEWKAEEPVLSIEAGAKGPLERSQRFRAAALDNLRSHPGAYAAMVLRRVPLLLIGGHSNTIAGLEGTTAGSRGPVLLLKLALLALNTLLLLLTAAGLWLCRGRWPALWPLYVTLLVPPIVYLLLFAVPRYLIPVMPTGCLFAAEAALRLRRAPVAPEPAG
jgi:4-amino-4-deoxy-L-arabinose transferase-like glycosyltransferase